MRIKSRYSNLEFKLNIIDEDNKEYQSECQLKSNLIIPFNN